MEMEKLIEKVEGSKYTLVVVAAKRARNIVEGENPRVLVNSNKPVVIALHEIAANKILWERYRTKR